MHNSTIKNEEHLDNVRQFILDKVKRGGPELSLKTLSLAVGKNPAYIHQFIFRGSPRHLPEDVRHILAGELGVHEHALRPDTDGIPANANAPISYIDHPSQTAHKDGPWFVPKSFLEQVMHCSAQHIRLAMVGDSTADFGIATGDVIMMDTTDSSPLTAGYFAIDAGDHIRVRHLEQIGPRDTRVMVSGNGPKTYTFGLRPADILGRVIFHAQIFNFRPAARKSSPSAKAIGSLS